MVGWRRNPYDKASTELTAPVHALHDRLRQWLAGDRLLHAEQRVMTTVGNER